MQIGKRVIISLVRSGSVPIWISTRELHVHDTCHLFEDSDKKRYVYTTCHLYEHDFKRRVICGRYVSFTCKGYLQRLMFVELPA